MTGCHSGFEQAERHNCENSGFQQLVHTLVLVSQATSNASLASNQLAIKALLSTVQRLPKSL